MIRRIEDRATFVALRRARRARSGSVTVAHLPATTPNDPVRVAFAVGRAVGGAVTRNRVRRRLRELVRSMVSDGAIPRGSYLISAAPAAAVAPSSVLGRDLRGALDRLFGDRT